MSMLKNVLLRTGVVGVVLGQIIQNFRIGDLEKTVNELYKKNDERSREIERIQEGFEKGPDFYLVKAGMIKLGHYLPTEVNTVSESQVDYAKSKHELEKLYKNFFMNIDCSDRRLVSEVIECQHLKKEIKKGLRI